jgi:hypothetical protein
VEDTLASVETVVRAQDKLGFRLLDKPKSFYFHDKGQGEKNASNKEREIVCTQKGGYFGKPLTKHYSSFLK